MTHGYFRRPAVGSTRTYGRFHAACVCGWQSQTTHDGDDTASPAWRAHAAEDPDWGRVKAERDDDNGKEHWA